MHRLAILLVLAVLCLSPGIVRGADWPQFRGPNADGISPEKLANKNWKQNPPKVLWKIPLGDDGYAGPSVAAGKLFIIDHKGNQDIVRAIDIKTGKDVWQFAYEDGEKPNYGFSRATPVINGNKVYALGRLGVLNCLDVKTGKKLWSRNICKEFDGKKPGWEYAMSPLVDGNKLILCPGGPNASVVALDKNTGKTIWKGGGSDVPGYATPVPLMTGGKKQYVTFTAVSLIGVDANDGTLLWSIPWKTSYDINAATPIVLGSTVFATSGYNHGCALLDVSSDSAKIRWETKDLASRFSSPIYHQGHFYGISEPGGDLVCIDGQTGSVKWKQPGFEFGGLVAIDGMLIAADGKDGDIIMSKLSPDSYQELGRTKPLGGQSWTAPIISNGKLIVRNKTELACLAL
ncbi:MAG: PQQ-binding-like beta-propeller repeat protein [Armatimonadetes bacterium]|nr:PQQ-binding-like beta-propeller repeat protein [Armatimonadota bacterium]